ncbi:MAG: YciI family protein [Gemmatimonadota bacterium]
MKFLVMIYSDSTLIDAIPRDQFNATMRDCLAHADALRQRGKLLDTQMLESASSAKSVRVRNGRRTVVDGPFTETKELLAGFNLIEAENMDEAVLIASEFPWAETGCIEVREVIDVDLVRQRVK